MIERTDQGEQFVMPGAERSAVQASAGRGDMKRSNKRQQPADVGLFAPIEVPQPSMFGE